MKLQCALTRIVLASNADLWGVVGLLHDFDYERYPDVSASGHPNRGAEILRGKGVDEVVVRAILAHAPEVTGTEPESSMEKSLVAVDELTGFLIAVALVRPSRSILDVELKSVKKKWKDKAFAAPVNREEIEHAATPPGSYPRPTHSNCFRCDEKMRRPAWASRQSNLIHLAFLGDTKAPAHCIFFLKRI